MEPQKAKEEEFYDGGDPDYDYNELNRTQTIPRYTNNISSYVDVSDVKPVAAYEALTKEYDNPEAQSHTVNETQSTSGQSEENPITKFQRIKKDIDNIEKDIAFYTEHKDLFKGEVSLEKSLSELKKLKQIANYIYTSENYKTLQKIINTQNENKTNLPNDRLNVLNKTVYDKLNEHLLNRVSIINRLKADNPTGYSNLEYELFIAPDTEKVKQFTKIIEIKKTINSIEQKIGEWNYEAKKRSIASVVSSIKNNLRLFDKEFQNEIKGKMDALGKRINEIKAGNEDFYNQVNKQKLDDLYSGFTSSKDVEEVIFNTITKMESLKNNHEESAFISLKLKELIDQQEKIKVTIDENGKILDSLKDNIKANVEVMKKNVEAIKKKLK